MGHRGNKVTGVCWEKGRGQRRKIQSHKTTGARMEAFNATSKIVETVSREK